MRSSVQNFSKTRHAWRSGTILTAKMAFFRPSMSFLCVLFPSQRCDSCLGLSPSLLILCVTVSLPAYIFCTPPSPEIDQCSDVLFTRRAVLALTWILQQSLNTFRASCKTWQGQNQRGANPAAVTAARGASETTECIFFMIFLLKFEFDNC